MLTLLVAVPASASILSATGQTMGTRSPSADYLRVTTVQDELNTTMREMNDGAAAHGAISAQAPTSGGGAYVLQKEGDGGTPMSFSKPELFVPGDSHESGRIAIGSNDGSAHTRHLDNNHDTHRNDPHAAPEPSTWMLLATGLVMLGGYTVLRRRAAIDS
jgi:hypothetical protein